MAISIVLLIVVSDATPSIAVDNSNNASNPFGDIFSSESITANNTPFSLSSNTIYVPDSYTTIQDAANAGDTIIVRDGTYTEDVNVNKRLTITSEKGSASTIVQAVNQNDHVFEVTADYVSGLTVKEEIIFIRRCTLSNKGNKILIKEKLGREDIER